MSEVSPNEAQDDQPDRPERSKFDLSDLAESGQRYAVVYRHQETIAGEDQGIVEIWEAEGPGTSRSRDAR
jgi:hypothetical protein